MPSRPPESICSISTKATSGRGPTRDRHGEEPQLTDNVETYERIIKAFNAGGIDAVMGYFHEDIEVHDPDLLGGRPIRGHEDLRQALTPMLDSWESLSVRDFDLFPAGDSVVALIHLSATGEGTQGEMEVEMRDAHTMTFRDGKVAFWRLYLDQREALTDAGLDPGLANSSS